MSVVGFTTQMSKLRSISAARALAGDLKTTLVFGQGDGALPRQEIDCNDKKHSDYYRISTPGKKH